MEKEALYEIRYHLNETLLLEHYSRSISLKKRIWCSLLLACVIAGVSYWSLTHGALLAGYTCEVIAIFALAYPFRLKRCVMKFYQKDENIYDERCLRLFDDHFELETTTGLANVNYSSIKTVVEGTKGIYIHVSSIYAFCIPKEAFTPDALAFLQRVVICNQ